MKNTKPSLLIAALLGLFSISCGDNFDNTTDAAPVCVYNGVRYAPKAEWKAKDGCNICVCGFSGQVMCSKDLVCGDGGASDSLPSTDSAPDQRLSSDALYPVSDTKGPDFGPIDAPGRNDASVSDTAADGAVSDGRLD